MKREECGGRHDEETDDLPLVGGEVRDEGVHAISEENDPGDGEGKELAAESVEMGWVSSAPYMSEEGNITHSTSTKNLAFHPNALIPKSLYP